jgi:DNA-binding HxlR family transcriptional regulator
VGVPRRKNRSRATPDECPLTHCMRLIGKAWAPHLVWYLEYSPRRFSELKADIRGISSKVLSARLRELTRVGVLKRNELRTSPPTMEYELTSIGRELLPAIAAIVAVGQKLKGRDQNKL